MTDASVLLDVGPAVHQRAGLSRYAARLALQLHRAEADRIDLTLFFNTHSDHWLPESLADLPYRAIPMGQYRWRISALTSQLARTWMATVRGRRLMPDLYHATEHLLPRVPMPAIMTVHDLIFERYPEHHTRRNRLFLKLAMPRFVRGADALIAVSEQTRRDLIELYGTPAEKITVIPEGIDARFTPATAGAIAAVRDRVGLTRPYLLMVGTLEPRKNHATAMAALARLRAAGHDLTLVVVGGHGWKFDPIAAQVGTLGLTGAVIFTGYVPDADLPPLYSGAAAVLVPSLFEGFGFPVLEAMACAAPVICSNVSSLPEVAGDAALQIPPTDDAALAAAVTRIMTEPDLVDGLRGAGLARAASYTWQECARRTADLYCEVAARFRTR